MRIYRHRASSSPIARNEATGYPTLIAYRRQDLDSKLLAAVRGCRLAIPHMRRQGGGRIVNVTNVDGKAPSLGSLPASVSRAAGIALTKALSKQYAADNILVNTICIGFIRSGQNDRRALGLIAGTPGATLDGWYAEAGKAVPLGRVGLAEEAGDVIAFLASDRASIALTGPCSRSPAWDMPPPMTTRSGANR